MFLPKKKIGPVQFQHQALPLPDDVVASRTESVTHRRDVVGNDSTYRRSDSAPAKLNQTTDKYVEAIQEVVSPHKKKLLP